MFNQWTIGLNSSNNVKGYVKLGNIQPIKNWGGPISFRLSALPFGCVDVLLQRRHNSDLLSSVLSFDSYVMTSKYYTDGKKYSDDHELYVYTNDTIKEYEIWLKKPLETGVYLISNLSYHDEYYIPKFSAANVEYLTEEVFESTKMPKSTKATVTYMHQ